VFHNYKDQEYMTNLLSNKHRQLLWLTLLSIIAIRFLILGTYPLQDTTEARYGEMARKMLETNNWITPQFDYGVPFWGKPPLSVWLSAGSYKLFGLSEFSARLPSLILSIFMLLLVYNLGKQHRNQDTGLVAATLLAGCMVFFIMSGAVLMDPALAAGTVLSMAAFWHALHSSNRSWGYLFFTGAAIGLMAKGPVALVLIFTPITLWLFWQRNFREAYQKIPWFKGSMLMLLLSLPWYVIAEIRTPGFLEYFIVGEHWNRFIESGWQGDLYGSAHKEPTGKIWLYAAFAFLPWIFILPGLLWRARKSASVSLWTKNTWLSYLVIWTLTPLLFFTFSKNILATYTLPALAPLALITAELWMYVYVKNESMHFHLDKKIRMIAALSFFVPALYIFIITSYFTDKLQLKSQRELMDAYYQLRPDSRSRVLYFPARPFSAEFYSQGKALELADWGQGTHDIENEIVDFYIVHADHKNQIPDAVNKKIKAMKTYKKYTLFMEQGVNKYPVAGCPQIMNKT